MRSRDRRWKLQVKVLCFYRCDGGAAAVMRRTNPVLHTARLNQAAPDGCNLSTGGPQTQKVKGRRVVARYPQRPPLRVIKPARADAISLCHLLSMKSI